MADPLTGLTAADACLRALASGGRWLLDVSMSAVSAGLSAARPFLLPAVCTVAHPQARPVEAGAPALGPTPRVLSELGIDP